MTDRSEIDQDRSGEWNNPPVDHRVNVERGSPLAEFARLAAGFALACGLLVLLTIYATRWLLPLVPYATEQQLGDALAPALTPEPGDELTRQRLQALADRLAKHLALPNGVQVQVQYSMASEVNAYAQFGGHIIVTHGLLQRMPSENALALVIAHELGHVKNRDALLKAGSGLALALIWSVATGSVPAAGGSVLELAQLQFSRDQERAADDLAIDALKGEYGHAGGAAEVFRIFAAEQGISGKIPDFLSTHPGHAERISRLQSAASDWDEVRLPLRPPVR